MSETREYVSKPETVRATPWNKAGDHKAVIYTPDGEYVLYCDFNAVVRPGCWIVEHADGRIEALSGDLFYTIYSAPAPAPAAPPRGAAEGDGVLGLRAEKRDVVAEHGEIDLGALPRSRGPSREWLERAGNIEDECRSVSVGGLAVTMGLHKAESRVEAIESIFGMAEAAELREFLDRGGESFTITVHDRGDADHINIAGSTLRALLAAAEARLRVGEATRKVLEAIADVARRNAPPSAPGHVSIVPYWGHWRSEVSAKVEDSTIAAALREWGIEVPR